ncbi:hypothetical protein B0A48_04226 [Cryoendolithus antarcticus]|uniref:Uncharacterized protein n=1 Tax=Cryoendolithus antarcticus TaxID=1507870 RepID=A0A1V8TER7_9PEZI|nr:hypothetical protein B0A48_04226 [Cryoendolithus antarcticus]
MDPQTHTSLTTILSRLDRTISASTSQHLTSYDHVRIRSNLDHARTLLLTLEKQSSGIRVASQRSQAQKELVGYREQVKGLGETLKSLDDAQVDDGDSTDSEDDAEDDVRAREYAPARSDANAGLDVGDKPMDNAAAQLHNELRARKPLSANDNRSAASNSARETLFQGRSPQASTSQDPSNTESLLSHNRTEQEALTTGLLSLAKALKESSQQFGASLSQRRTSSSAQKVGWRRVGKEWKLRSERWAC